MSCNVGDSLAYAPNAITHAMTRVSADPLTEITCEGCDGFAVPFFPYLALQSPVICTYGTADSTQCWMAPALTGRVSSSFIQALHAA